MHSRGRKESQRNNKVLPHLQSPTKRTEERLTKIKQQKEKMSEIDRHLYDKFRQGNEEADRLAGSKTVPNSASHRHRDWIKDRSET